MRKLLMVVVGAALAASSAFAGVLPTVKAMVDRLGPRADTVLARSGISDPVAVAAVLSADETQVVNTLANSTKVGNVATAIALSLLCDEWSPAGLASVEGFVRESENKNLAKRLGKMCSAPATSNLWRPLEARKALRPLIAAVYSVLYPTRPGWCAYNVTKAITGAVGIEDNVALLLAPEEGQGETIVGSKNAIFDAAVV
ncbi:MAG: hypothetical protein NTV49_05430, partial [Kiritimatiellaeota bacterium]|nr:hypothetical protein [Kiritimatiellota bacterium]